MTRAVSSSDRTLEVEPLDKCNSATIEAMIGLFQQGQKPHHSAFPAHFGPAVETAAITHYLNGFLKPRNPLRKRYGFAKGLFIDNALAGYLLYRLNQSNNIFYGETRWTCFVEDIVVDDRARGLGGASAMMEALLADIGPLSNCVISGTVWNANAASEALFTKHGFEPLTKAFYKVSK